jgi:hypothetical protein
LKSSTFVNDGNPHSFAFVDSPTGAVTEAEDLASSVMTARGYPVSDFDQRAADISVDHPRAVPTSSGDQDQDALYFR